MKISKFTNELGAKTMIKVKNAAEERVAPNGERVRYRGVSLSIHDDKEWLLTREEAKQLSATLSAFLAAAPEKPAPDVNVEPAQVPAKSQKNRLAPKPSQVGRCVNFTD